MTSPNTPDPKTLALIAAQFMTGRFARHLRAEGEMLSWR